MAHRGRRVNKKGKSKGGFFKVFVWISVIVIALAFVCGLILRHEKSTNNEEVRIYIPSDAEYNDVVEILKDKGCLNEREAFDAMAKFRRYTGYVKGGSYLISAKMPLYDMVNKLRSGNQDPIRIVIGQQRSLKTLCSNLGDRFEFSGNELYSMLTSDSVCKHYNLSRPTILALFVQNSYDIYWTISTTAFLDRMEKEYKHFWHDGRMRQCKALNLSPAEVTTLASIVEEETNMNDEKPLIASVYLNRIRKKMPLQADPTVRYAVGNFSLRRILTEHTLVDSPYNTYKHMGLPPGPICIPSAVSIDAVLDNERTDYLYFCAKEDFSGRHNFANTLAEHSRNAEKFHKALNARKIFK